MDTQKYNYILLMFSPSPQMHYYLWRKEVLFTDKVLPAVTVAKLLLSAPYFAFLSQEVVYLFLIFPECPTPLPSPPFFIL